MSAAASAPSSCGAPPEKIGASRMTDTPLRPPVAALEQHLQHQPQPPQHNLPFAAANSSALSAGGGSASVSASGNLMLSSRPGSCNAPAISAAPGESAAPQPPGSSKKFEVRFSLELAYARDRAVVAVPVALRSMPVVAAECVGSAGVGGKRQLRALIGRLYQPEFFEAWLPDMSLRSCVSRKAFEILWTEGSNEAFIVSHGTHPLSTNGKVLAKSVQEPLQQNAEIRLTFESRVLVCLQFRWRPPQEAGRSALPHVLAAPPSPALGPMPSPSPSPAAPTFSPPVRAPTAATAAPLASPAPELRGVAPKEAEKPSTAAAAPADPDLMHAVFDAAAMAQTFYGSAGFAAGAADNATTVDSPTSPTSATSNPDSMLRLRSLEAARVERDMMRVMKSKSSPRTDGGQTHPSLPITERPATEGVAAFAKEEADSPSRRLSDWRLVCLHAEGLASQDSSNTPSAELSAIDLEEGVSHIGRHHQPRHFAVWLKDPGVRFGSLSATHLRLAVSSTNVGVTCLSASGAVYIGRDVLRPGDVRELRAGQLLSFSRTSGTVDESFLVLQLLRNGSGSRTAANGTAGVQNGEAIASAAAPSLSLQPPMTGSGQGRIPVAPASPDGAPAAKSIVSLELMGDGAQDVPAERRRIGPQLLGDEPLLIGTRFQRELHEAAVKPEYQRLLRDDQFCIAFSGGQFWLLVLSPDSSVWHVRPSSLSCDELRRDALVTLRPKDEICLGPGLYWRFDQVDINSMAAGPSVVA